MTEDSPLAQDPADREADIARSMVRIAELTLQADDELAVLEDVVHSCVRILDGDAAGISLAVDGSLGFVIATDEEMRLVELLQEAQQQGPCMEAFRSGNPTRIPDLHDDPGRWPAWTDRALELGFRAAEAFPMRYDERIIGVIDFYATRTRALNDRDLLVGQLLAEMASLAVVGHRSTAGLREVNVQLQTALDSRVAIEQAKGILSERHGVGQAEAFDLLRRYARHRRQKLRSVAEQVVDDGLDPTGV